MRRQDKEITDKKEIESIINESNICRIALYRSATYSVSSSGKYEFALMILILLVLYIGNIFGPPPPDMISVAVTMTAGQLALVALAFWVDRNRIANRHI